MLSYGEYFSGVTNRVLRSGFARKLASTIFWWTNSLECTWFPLQSGTCIHSCSNISLNYGFTTGGLVCHQMEHQTTALHVSNTGHTSLASGYIHSELAGSASICIPPTVFSIAKSSGANTTVALSSYLHRSVATNTTMVHATGISVSRDPKVSSEHTLTAKTTQSDVSHQNPDLHLHV